jgi:hypothetical protein
MDDTPEMIGLLSVTVTLFRLFAGLCDFCVHLPARYLKHRVINDGDSAVYRLFDIEAS